MNITKPTEKSSAAAEIDAVALRLSTAFPANGQAKKPQPQRRWLAAIFTAVAFLLAAGGAQAQDPSTPTVISATAPHGLYKLNDVLPITVLFSEVVTVNTDIGTPEMDLHIRNDDESATVAVYTAGSNSTMLTFVFTVREGDNSFPPNLQYNGITAIDLMGSTIQSIGGVAANLNLPSPSDFPISDSASDPIIVDGVAPAAPSFTDPTAVAGDDNIINAAERSTGLTLTGGTVADVDSVHICFNGTPDFAPTGVPGCDGGATRSAFKDTNTTWSYDLSATRITEFLASGVLTEGGTSTIIIIATDAAGNRAMSASVTISTDAVAAVSTNADLLNLVLTDPNVGGGGTITLDPPTFNAAVTSYTATVVNSVTSVTVTPTVADNTATVAVLVGVNEETGDIMLSEGETAITVRVTAEDGITIKNYFVTVTRAALTNSLATGATITGVLFFGQTLTAGDITDDNGVAGAAFLYQWQRGTADGADGGYEDIASATAATLVLTDDHVGRRIRVIVSFTDDDGYAETVTSVATTAVPARGPIVLSVAATEGIYGFGQVVNISVTFDQVVDVTVDVPYLDMNNGGQAHYHSGGGSTALLFRYTVRSGDNTDSFAYSDEVAFKHNGAEILSRDVSPLDAILTLPMPLSSGFPNVVLDGIDPTATTTINVAKTDGTSLTSGDTTTATSLVLSGTVSGTLDASDMVNIYDGGTLLTQVVVTGTTWSYTDNSLVFGDSPVYSARVADAAGNLGPESVSFSLLIRAVSATFTITDLVSGSVMENAVYTSVTPVVVSGNPIGGTSAIRWSLKSPESDPLFSIADDTIGIVTLPAQDFENEQDVGSDNTYQYILVGTDADGNIDESLVTIITILDDDTESATFTITDLVSGSVMENAVYTSVTPVVVSGNPIGGAEAIRWSLKSPESDPLFSIADDTIGIVTLPAQDFENEQDVGSDNTYQYILVGTDADGNAVEESTVTIITILDDDTESATFTITDLVSGSVMENAVYTSVTPVVVSGSPIGGAEAIRWSLKSPESDPLFSIADDTIGIVTLPAQDFENEQDVGGDNTYQYILVGTDADGNAVEESTVTIITILDDDTESATFTITDLVSGSVMENAVYTSVTPVVVSGSPIGGAEAIRWSLKSPESDPLFSIADDTIGIVTLPAQDFEDEQDVGGDNTYQYILVGTDADGNAVEESTVTIITILDDDTESATFTITDLVSGSVMENAVYTSVTPVVVSGSPIGGAEAIRWSLKSPESDPLFSIADDTIGIVTLPAQDFEDEQDVGGDNTYQYILVGTDADGNAVEESTVTIITILDDDTESATFTITDLVSGSVMENAVYTSVTPVVVSGSPIGGAEAIRWSLKSPESDPLFSIADDTIGIVTLPAQDFEDEQDVGGDNTYQYILVGTDADGNAVEESTVTIITILDDDTESATFTITDLVSGSVMENAVYTSVTPVVVSGSPIGGAEAIRWSLKSPESDPLFSIADETIGIVTLPAQDFENEQDVGGDNTYQYILVGTDADGNAVEESTVTIITILDDDTESATFTITDLVSGSVMENAVYTSVTPVVVSGSPIGGAEAIRWSLKSPESDPLFSIADDTIGIVTLPAQDFENEQDVGGDNTYQYILVGTDADGNAVEESTVTIITILDDDTESATFTITDLVSGSVMENAVYTSVTPVVVSGSPIGGAEAIRWSLKSPESDPLFSIADDTIGIVTLPAQDFENEQDVGGDNTYQYILVGTDADGNAVEESTVTIITILDDDTESATFTITDLVSGSVMENAVYTSVTPVVVSGSPIGGAEAIRWSLKSPESDPLFSIADDTIGIVTLPAQDFEDEQDVGGDNTYQYILVGTDADGNAVEESTVTIITILDDDTESATFTITDLVSGSVMENAVYTSATPVVVSGSPIGGAEAIRWSLKSPESDPLFSIADDTIGIVTLPAQDFEDEQDVGGDNTYQYILVGTDADGNAVEESTVTIITILDDDTESATFTITDLVSGSVMENAVYTSATPVVVSGNPIGGAEAIRWSLKSPESDPLFSIADDTIGIVTLPVQDFEDAQDAGTDNTYQYILVGTDADGTSMKVGHHYHHSR